MIMSILSIILPAASLPVVRAAPWQTVRTRQSNGDNPNTAFSPSVWIPIIAVGVFFLLAGLFVFRKKMPGLANRRTAASGNVVSSGISTTTAGQARELTATELADGTRPTTAATRRPRRPRRTPSQVSTRSLPAYMREPGDHEVVIYRGLEDMDEEAEGEHRDVNNSTTTTPDTTLNTEGTGRNSPDITRVLLPPRTDSPESVRHSVNLSRGSYDHHGSDESHARLIDVRRGEAPAYETINLDVTAAPVHRHENSQHMRISGFFSRFMPHRTNSGTTNEPATLSAQNAQNSTSSPSHSREPSAQSGASGIASADSHGSPRGSGVGRTHRDRNNNSSTASVFTVLSRTRSRNHDDAPLTSPSVVSLNSISPPLTHTTTRTEFTYPPTGPTSEQIKFLSSRETFGRFGLPYGPDAMSFAASSSRLHLPPDFDSIHRPGFGDILPDAGDGSSSSLGRLTSARGLSNGGHPDRGESPFPESAKPSPDLASMTDPPSQLSSSTPDLQVGVLTSPSQSLLSKQKSTPNLGVGHLPLSKSALKPKSMANLRSDGGGSLPPRSISVAGSYLTVESFRTAHDDADGPVPPSPAGTQLSIPQITVQLPSNNPSLTNVAEGASGSETEFFDGDEDTEVSDGGDEEGEGVHSEGNNTLRAASANTEHQLHDGGSQEVEEDDPSSLTDEDDSESSASEPNRQGLQDTRASTSSESESGSDDESEAETHSNHTEVDKTLVTADLEGQMRHIHEGTDVTLTPEMVAVTIKTSSADLTKTSKEMSRTTTIKA